MNSRDYRNRPTKFLLIVTATSTAQLFMKGFAEHVASAGHDVTLAANDLSELGEDLNRVGVQSRSVRMERNPTPLQDILSLLQMIRLMREIKPDVVLYATPKASLFGSIAARFSGVPVRVYGLWGLRLETFRGLRRFLLKIAERAIASNSTSVLANSYSLAHRAIELGLCRQGKVSVVLKGSSHGVDSNHFDPDRSTGAVDTNTRTFLDQKPGFTVGYIGRIHPDKGVDTLLEAVSALEAQNIPVRTLLIGEYEGAASAVGKAIENSSVHLSGRVNDVRPYLQELDLLVLMSLREGFPNVVLEAAAMRVPSIVSDATGCVDSVIAGQTGLIVPVGDSEKLQVQIRELITDPSRRKQLGDNARSRVIADFQPRTIWQETMNHLLYPLRSGHDSDNC